ncbi:MAG: hypothetical protein JOZ97_08280 [Candidatus Eremiobacteraeota bacterium]|nr:hypothetical protein [Candidatus Eremiobacteraeota bacterium]
MRLLFSVIVGSLALSAVAMAADSGPRADVAALRGLAMRPHTTIDNVRVVGNYAVLEWIMPPAGGMSAYKRTAGEHWKLLMTEGGVIGANELMKKGVPAAAAHKLLPGTP